MDFVGYGACDFWAIEVEHLARVQSADVKSLQAFVSDYPECRPMLLYRGRERVEVGGIPWWPVEGFLAGLQPGEDVTGVNADLEL